MAKEERKLSEEEIKNRLQEIIDELEDEESEADTEKLEEESRSLTNQLKEMKKMEARNKLAEDINNGVIEAEKVEVESEEARKQEVSKIEARANAYKATEWISFENKYFLLGDCIKALSDIIEDINNNYKEKNKHIAIEGVVINGKNNDGGQRYIKIKHF